MNEKLSTIIMSAFRRQTKFYFTIIKARNSVKPPARRIQLPFTTKSKKKNEMFLFLYCLWQLHWYYARANNGDFLIIAFVRRVSKIVICPRFLFYLFAVTNYITLGGVYIYATERVSRHSNDNIWNANRNVFAINFGLLCQSQ